MSERDFDSGQPGAGSSRKAKDLDVHIGERLKRRRTELGLSLDGLAQTLGITRTQLSKYESGENRIAASRLADVARELHVAVTWFLEGDAISQQDQSAIERSAASTLAGLYLDLHHPFAKRLLQQVALLIAELDAEELRNVAQPSQSGENLSTRLKILKD